MPLSVLHHEQRLPQQSLNKLLVGTYDQERAVWDYFIAKHWLNMGHDCMEFISTNQTSSGPKVVGRVRHLPLQPQFCLPWSQSLDCRGDEVGLQKLLKLLRQVDIA